MPDVMDIAKKAFLTGIGLALTAKDEAEELAKEIENKLNLNEEEGKKILKDIQNRYEDTQNKLEERVEKSVKKFLKKADIVTADELKALKKEIRELKESLNKSASTSEN
ncbi:MAG: hypothetical protein HF981_11015 [Desulfobacteraceae bacterium]|nr:hypothetical protein [Desulfobacteraceae bacterium]MBC2750905.1 phasin family protein [Desulfobacteraceae bacterium]